MIQTDLSQAIVPLDLTSMMQLLSTSSPDYAPLSYHIDSSDLDSVTVQVNTQLCDSNSMQIQVEDNQLILFANVDLQFLSTDGSASVVGLKRRCSQHIDLPIGVDLGNIRSQVNDDNVSIYIPFIS
ncbi:MAG: hypothetical protein ACO3K7_02875 [Candidatus Marinamargulisbacteria bacterium]